MLLHTAGMYAQSNCICFKGLASNDNKEPSLYLNFSNEQSIVVCGSELEKTDSVSILITEFNVFDCKTGNSIAEYSATKRCKVSIKKDTLSIVQMKHLPAGNHWEWIDVPVGIEYIYADGNAIRKSTTKACFTKIVIAPKLINQFYAEIDTLISNKVIIDSEGLIGKLEVLALNDDQKAKELLLNFNEKFAYRPDGSSAELLIDAVNTLLWLDKQNKQ